MPVFYGNYRPYQPEYRVHRSYTAPPQRKKPPLVSRDITINDQIKEVKRELKMRERAYPRYIESGKLAADRADYQIKVLTKVLETLKGLTDGVQ